LTVFKHGLLRSESIEINFDTPLKIFNTLYFEIECGAITLNAYSINFQGWEEEI